MGTSLSPVPWSLYISHLQSDILCVNFVLQVSNAVKVWKRARLDTKPHTVVDSYKLERMWQFHS